MLSKVEHEELMKLARMATPGRITLRRMVREKMLRKQATKEQQEKVYGYAVKRGQL